MPPLAVPIALPLYGRTLLFFPASFWDGGLSSFYTKSPTHLEKGTYNFLLILVLGPICVLSRSIFVHAAIVHGLKRSWDAPQLLVVDFVLPRKQSIQLQRQRYATTVPGDSQSLRE